jgi:uncharacterized protein (DUF1015 family)
MRVITSQRYYRNEDIITEKIEQLKEATKITLTVWETEMKNELGQDLYILADGHHTYEAAKELGLDIEFEIEKHPEGLVGEELLEVAWMDGDYCYLDGNSTVW